jgi:hypothetical protein
MYSNFIDFRVNLKQDLNHGCRATMAEMNDRETNSNNERRRNKNDIKKKQLIDKEPDDATQRTAESSVNDT